MGRWGEIPAAYEVEFMECQQEATLGKIEKIRHRSPAAGHWTQSVPTEGEVTRQRPCGHLET